MTQLAEKRSQISLKIKENCISIWLNASEETLLERLKNTTKRPLLDVDNRKEILLSLLIAEIISFKALFHIVLKSDIIFYLRI